ncbi:MAG: hypothetical protein ACJ8J0_01175 [Longimicrobiaceae bacterium]
MRPSSLLLAAALAAGCTHGASPAPPAPIDDTAQTARLPPRISSVIIEPWVNYCIVRGGRLESVTADLLAGGDTVYGGMAISKAFPIDSTYALNAGWYRDNESIPFARGRYVKYGQVWILATTDVVPTGIFHGVTVFVEAGVSRVRPEALYVPVQPGCEFQPYIATGPK